LRLSTEGFTTSAPFNNFRDRRKSSFSSDLTLPLRPEALFATKIPKDLAREGTWKHFFRTVNRVGSCDPNWSMSRRIETTFSGIFVRTISSGWFQTLETLSDSIIRRYLISLWQRCVNLIWGLLFFMAMARSFLVPMRTTSFFALVMPV
jgi:hypothetical protein